MVVRGHVQNGRIELDEQGLLPEGSSVEVNVLPEASNESPQRQIPTLYEELEPLIGALDDLPSDFATNLDHYLYGLPKR